MYDIYIRYLLQGARRCDEIVDDVSGNPDHRGDGNRQSHDFGPDRIHVRIVHDRAVHDEVINKDELE